MNEAAKSKPHIEIHIFTEQILREMQQMVHPSPPRSPSPPGLLLESGWDVAESTGLEVQSPGEPFQACVRERVLLSSAASCVGHLGLAEGDGQLQVFLLLLSQPL